MDAAEGSEVTIVLTGAVATLPSYAPVFRELLQNSPTEEEPECMLFGMNHRITDFIHSEKYTQTLRLAKGTAKSNEEREEAAPPSEESMLFDAEFEAWDGWTSLDEEEGYDIVYFPVRHIMLKGGQIVKPVVARAVKRHAVTLGLTWEDAVAHLPQLLADLPSSAPLRYVVLDNLFSDYYRNKTEAEAVIDALADSPHVVGVFFIEGPPPYLPVSAMSRICSSKTYLAIQNFFSRYFFDRVDGSVKRNDFTSSYYPYEYREFVRSLLQNMLSADGKLKQLCLLGHTTQMLDFTETWDELKQYASNCLLTRFGLIGFLWVDWPLLDLLASMNSLTDVGLMIVDPEQMQLLLRSKLHTRITTLRLSLRSNKFPNLHQINGCILQGLMDRACTIQFLTYYVFIVPVLTTTQGMIIEAAVCDLFDLLAAGSNPPVRLAALRVSQRLIVVNNELIASVCKYLCAPAARELVHLDLRLRQNGRPDIQTAAEWELAKSLSNNFTLCHLGFSWKNSAAETFAISKLQRNKLYRASKLLAEDPVKPNLAKLFVCGHPEVGKTTMSRALLSHQNPCHRLILSPTRCCFLRCKSSPDRTRGMEMHPLIFRGRDSNFMICDLAGQEEYHVLHHYFMNATNNDIFIVVCKYEDSSTDVLFKRQLEYWLRFVLSHKSTRTKKSLLDASVNETKINPKIIVVINFFGPNTAEATMKAETLSWTSPFKEKYSEFIDFIENEGDQSLFWVNAKTGFQVQHVYKRLESLQEDFSNTAWPVPKLCYDISSLITKCEGRRSWFCPNYLASKPKILTTFSAIHELCNNNATIDPIKIGAALQELDAQGYVIYFPSEDTSGGHGTSSRTKIFASENSTRNELVIVDTNWFCNKLIGSLLGPRTVSSGRDQWRWSKDGIMQILRKEGCQELYLEEIMRYLLRLELCVAVGSAPSGEEEFLFPALCKDKEVEYLQKNRENFTKFFGRRMKCKDDSMRIIPWAIFMRLQVKLYKAYSDFNHSFQFGYGWISFMRGRVEVVVRFGMDVINEAWESKHCIDILTFCPPDSLAESSQNSQIKYMDDRRFVDAEKLICEVQNHFHAACEGGGVGGIPTVEMEEMVLQNEQESSDAIPLAVILAKVNGDGLLNSWQEWKHGKSTDRLDLLLPAEIRDFVEGTLEALQSIEEEFCTCSTEEGDGMNMEQPEQNLETGNGYDAISDGPLTGDPVMRKLDRIHEDIRGVDRKVDKIDKNVQTIKEDILKLPEVLKGEAERIIANCSTRLLRHEQRKDRAYPLYPYLTDVDGKLAVLGNAVLGMKRVRVHFLCESRAGQGPHLVVGQKGRDVTVDWGRVVPVIVPAVKILCCMARLAAPYLPIVLPPIVNPKALERLLSGLGIERGAQQKVKWNDALEALLKGVPDVKWPAEREVQEAMAEILGPWQDLKMESEFGLSRIISEEDGRFYWVCEQHISGRQKAKVDPNPYN